MTHRLAYPPTLGLARCGGCGSTFPAEYFHSCPATAKAPTDLRAATETGLPGVEAPPDVESGQDASAGSWLDRSATDVERKAALWDALVTLARSDRVAEAYVALVRAREVTR